MPRDQLKSGYGEQPVEGDTIDVGEIFQILARNSRLIAVVTILVAAGTLFWTATRTPSYRARATLLLEQDEATGGVLSELASLTSDPAAEAEMAIIRSRSLAEVTASSPEAFTPSGKLFDGTVPDFDPVAAGDASEMDGLGLTTVVDPHDMRPSSGIWRRVTGGGVPSHRLRARMEVASPRGSSEEDLPELPEGVDVFFVDENTVRIVPHEGFLFPSDLSDEDAVEASYVAARPVEALGRRLWMEATGDYVGRRYRVRNRSEDQAVMTLMASTTAAESGRKTSVVNITVDDSCPYRAAETANALAKNYIRRSVQIGRQKAERTLGFIKGQLTDQLKALRAAETEVADLQTAHPETISLPDSAKAVIDQLSALELERTQLELARTVLEQALTHLDTGDFEALARLGGETPNLLALGYIKELATLEVESLRLDRSDIVGYKQLLQSEQLRLRTLIERSQLEVDRLELGLKAVAAGGADAVAHFAATMPDGESGVDLDAYFTALAQLDAEIARLRGGLTEENPAVSALEDSRVELIETISAQVQGVLVGVRASLASLNDLYNDYGKSIEQWPAQERGTIDRAMATLRARVRVTLTTQVGGLNDRIASIATKIGELDERLGALPQGQLTLAGATRDLQTYSQIVAFLQRSEQEAQITAAATSAAAVLIDPAFPPPTRSFPRVTLFTGLGIILGLILGCACAFIHNALQAALHTEAEVERASGLPVLGSIPDFQRGRTRIKGVKKVERALPMRDDPNGPQAEAYRAIRATLNQALSGKDALRTLAVTSCMRGEGKTTTNADLAIVFAKAGRKVLLVDGDLRRPQVHHIFSTERGPGFAEVLEGTADWRDCVWPGGIENLSVLPAGQTNSNVGELLAAAAATRALKELTLEYDLVVFDLPPAVVLADVASFASNLDAIILVYRSGMVPGRLLSRTVSMLRQAEVSLMGVIVNAVYVSRSLGRGGYGYGYGYGYGHSYGYGQDEKPSS